MENLNNQSKERNIGNIQIEQMNINDSDSWWNIASSAWPGVPRNSDKELMSLGKSGTCLIAKENGVPIAGMVGLINLESNYSPSLVVHMLGVSKEYQGKGVGKKLMEASFGMIKEKNVEVPKILLSQDTSLLLPEQYSECVEITKSLGNEDIPVQHDYIAITKDNVLSRGLLDNGRLVGYTLNVLSLDVNSSVTNIRSNSIQGYEEKLSNLESQIHVNKGEIKTIDIVKLTSDPLKVPNVKLYLGMGMVSNTYIPDLYSYRGASLGLPADRLLYSANVNSAWVNGYTVPSIVEYLNCPKITLESSSYRSDDSVILLEMGRENSDDTYLKSARDLHINKLPLLFDQGYTAVSSTKLGDISYLVLLANYNQDDPNCLINSLTKMHEN